MDAVGEMLAAPGSKASRLNARCALRCAKALIIGLERAAQSSRTRAGTDTACAAVQRDALHRFAESRKKKGIRHKKASGDGSLGTEPSSSSRPSPTSHPTRSRGKEDEVRHIAQQCTHAAFFCPQIMLSDTFSMAGPSVHL